MSYHTAVATSPDFYTALKEARIVADEIKTTLLEHDKSAEFYPYR